MKVTVVGAGAVGQAAQNISQSKILQVKWSYWTLKRDLPKVRRWT